MSTKTRRAFSPEFRLETAQLVVEQGYTHNEAAKAMGVDFLTIGEMGETASIRAARRVCEANPNDARTAIAIRGVTIQVANLRE
jgi:transposase